MRNNLHISIFYLKYVKVVEKKIEEKKNLKNEWSIFFSSVYSLNSSSLNLFVVVLAQTECHLVYVKLQLNIALLSISLLCTVTPSGFDLSVIVIALTWLAKLQDVDSCYR